MKKFLISLAVLLLMALACSNDGDGDDGFRYPDVRFINSAAGMAGWAHYDRLVPDPADYIRQHCRMVVDVLYSSGTDPNISDIETIYYEFTADVAISDAGGVSGLPKARKIRYAPGNVEQ